MKAVEEHSQWHHDFWHRNNSRFNESSAICEDKDSFFHEYLSLNWQEFQVYHVESWKRNAKLLGHYFSFGTWLMFTRITEAVSRSIQPTHNYWFPVGRS